MPPDADVRVTFAAINARLRAVVDSLVAAGRDPADPTAGLYVSETKAADYAQQADASPLDERLALAAGRLGLDALETAVLALCAAPELDPRYTPVIQFLHDDVARRLPSPRMAADVLEGGAIKRGDVLSCFAAEGRLRSLGAFEVLEGERPVPFIDRAVRLAAPLASFLLDVELDYGDDRLRTVAPLAHVSGRTPTLDRIAAVLAQPGTLPVLVAGPDAAELLAAATGAPLLVADVRDFADRSLRARAELLCALRGHRLAFDGLDDLDPETGRRFALRLKREPGRVLACARSRAASVAMGDVATLVIEVPPPTLGERQTAWRELSGSEESDDIAARFRLSIAQVGDATAIARVEAGAAGRRRPVAEDLAAGARQASASRLGELASRVPVGFDWDDLVLPERPQRSLRSISAYLRHRDRVLSEWGYGRRVARTQGLKVLFAGESGTGKTMAAQVLGHDLGLELFRVDLATIVSKYIGETEKNLDRIFDAAEGSNAILFFDEADALFGKRSDISDSHDRYANIEVAYLLQKMEGYPGAVILATNYKKNLDDAFIRRLDFSVDFPFPEAEDRRRIWALLLPDEAPLAGDVDLGFLATRFKLSGGSIRNCSLAAAFEAAEHDRPIGMEQLVRAVAVEYGKQGRLTLEADFEHFHAAIRRDAGAPPPAPAPAPEPAPAVPAPGARGRWQVQEGSAPRR